MGIDSKSSLRSERHFDMRTLAALCCCAAFVVAPVAAADGSPEDAAAQFDETIAGGSHETLEHGKQIFRYDTFGDEAWWGGTLGLHRAIEGSSLGGVGPGVSPNAALAAGLKVDVDALPAQVVNAIQHGQVNLNDPATTLALLKLNSVVGLTGFFNRQGTLSSMGIQCALCHSTVDDSLAPGIGHRRDGWANRDLNVGAIVALAPDLAPIAGLLGVDVPTVVQVLNSWGRGHFDAELVLDGKAFRPDGRTSAVLIPPAFGLAGVNLHTWTGWGSVTYWNAFVANLEMHGQGNFFDPRLNDASRFPVAAAAGFGNVSHSPDLITSKLASLHDYQLLLPAPQPPAGSFDAAAAKRGQAVFTGAGKCSGCHVPPLYTEAGWNMHVPAEVCVDDFQAARAPDGRYRTSPLKGLWSHAEGGFYHDGRFPTLAAVVGHYDACFNLGLSSAQQADLIEFLKSL
jgi:hypothetical protein